MASPILVGFGCKARHGKDTCVEHLVSKYSDQYDIRRYAFADVLKAEFYDVLLNGGHPYWNHIASQRPLGLECNWLRLPHPGLMQTEVRKQIAEEFGMRRVSPTLNQKVEYINLHKVELGKHLQYYGTDFIRAKQPFYWVDKLAAQVREDKPQVALIADMRFPNEALCIKASGGYTVKVQRWKDGVLWTDPTRDATHISETAMDNTLCDFMIDVEDGHLDELRADAEQVFEAVLAAVTPKMPDLDAVTAQLAA